MSTAIFIQSNGSIPLSPTLVELLQLKASAEIALNKEELLLELSRGNVEGEAVLEVSNKLSLILKKYLEEWKEVVNLGRTSQEEQARALFIYGWGRERLSQFQSISLEDCLEFYDQVYKYLNRSALSNLASLVPSVSRPKPNLKPNSFSFKRESAWVGEFLAERARSTLTLAYSLTFELSTGEQKSEKEMEDILNLLDLGCKQNLEALFTPLENETDNEGRGDASIVLGNARLLSEIIKSLPPFPCSELNWQSRITWSTHISDVSYIELALTANEQVENAQQAAKKLSSKLITELERESIRVELEEIMRALVPLEEKQGICLWHLGKTMLAAIRELYLTSSPNQTKNVSLEEEGESVGVPVPENELVSETRIIFSRATQHLENALTSYTRASLTSKIEKKILSRNKKEQSMLRRLETLYCSIEELDNETPSVVQSKNVRIERAMSLNDRLRELAITLGSTEESDQDSEEVDEEADGADEASEEETILQSNLEKLKLK